MTRPIARLLLFVCIIFLLFLLVTPTSASLLSSLFRHLSDSHRHHDGYSYESIASAAVPSPLSHCFPRPSHRSFHYPYRLHRYHLHGRHAQSHPYSRHQVAAAQKESHWQSESESDSERDGRGATAVAVAAVCQQREQRRRQQQQLEQQWRQHELEQLQTMIDALMDGDDDGDDGVGGEEYTFQEKPQLASHSLRHHHNQHHHESQSSSFKSGQEKSQRMSRTPQTIVEQRASGQQAMSRTSDNTKVDEQQNVRAQPISQAKQERQEMKSQTPSTRVQSGLPSEIGIPRLLAGDHVQPESIGVVSHPSSDSIRLKPDSEDEPVVQSSESNIEDLLAVYDDAFREASQLNINHHAAQGKAIDVSATFPGMSGENLRVEIRAKEGADEAGRAAENVNPVLVITGEKHYEDKLVLRSDEVGRAGRYGMARRSWKIPTAGEAADSNKDKDDVDVVDIGSARTRFDRSTYTLTVRFFKRQTVEDRRVWPRIMHALDEKFLPVRSAPGALTLPVKMVGTRPKEEPIVIDFPEQPYTKDEAANEDDATIDEKNVSPTGIAFDETITQQDTPIPAAPTHRRSSDASGDIQQIRVSSPLTKPASSPRPVSSSSHVERLPIVASPLTMMRTDGQTASSRTGKRVASPPTAPTDHDTLYDFCATSSAHQEMASSDSTQSVDSLVLNSSFLLVIGVVTAGVGCMYASAMWLNAGREVERKRRQYSLRSLLLHAKAILQSDSTSAPVGGKQGFCSRMIDQESSKRPQPEQKAQGYEERDDTLTITKPCKETTPPHRQRSDSPTASHWNSHPMAASNESMQSNISRLVHSIERDDVDDTDRDNDQSAISEASLSLPPHSPSSSSITPSPASSSSMSEPSASCLVQLPTSPPCASSSSSSSSSSLTPAIPSRCVGPVCTDSSGVVCETATDDATANDADSPDHERTTWPRHNGQYIEAEKDEEENGDVDGAQAMEAAKKEENDWTFVQL